MKPPIEQPPVFPQEQEKRRLNLLGNIVIIIATVLLTGFIVWSIVAPRNGTLHAANRTKCLSNLKQIGASLNLYATDHDDRLPPLYVFSETQGQASLDFKSALGPYLKQESLVCPEDRQAGNKTDFGYVHCKSLLGVIPNYSKGNRVLHLKGDIGDASKIPYLRDPVRRNGGWKPSGVDSTPETNVLYSPHGAAFVIMYLDTHVKSVSPIDINKQL
jgi:hypothetical protein